MSQKIVMPFGRPVLRAMVVVDHHGQMQVTAARVVLTGNRNTMMYKDMPLSPLEACSLLSNAVAGTLQAMCGAARHERK